MPRLLLRVGVAARAAVASDADPVAVSYFERLAEIAENRAQGATLGHPLRHLHPVR